MTAVVDTGVLVAAADRRDRLHATAADVLRSLRGEFVIPQPVTAEADYLIGRRAGRDARLRFLVAPLDGGSFSLLPGDGASAG